MRRCNECTLCCKLLPVRELKKGANEVCEFQRSGKGCTVYRGRPFPRSCGLWSCVWLLDESAPLPRPDRSHYVIDPSPEYIEVNGEPVPVVQVWNDPKFPHAHRDPALRAWLSELYDAKGYFALVRYDSTKALVLLPPQSTGLADWHEHTSGTGTAEHTAADIFRTLNPLRAL